MQLELILRVRFANRIGKCQADCVERGSSAFLVMRPCFARAILGRDDESPLPGSRCRCFIFLSPLIFLVCSLMRLCILSSSSFSLFRGPRR